MKPAKGVLPNVMYVPIIALAVQKWLIVPDCALIVLTSVTYVQRSVQEGRDLQIKWQNCVLTFVKPVLNNAANMIMTNVNAVPKNAECALRCAEAWLLNY
ncbi:MAG: hypothetical protein BGO69_01830 [Bacteroidetes bacterium 46-16]|nr:MAG: hypothetical protein BGO69_01830 [Bacteroidetes bacterium 46-16]